MRDLIARISQENRLWGVKGGKHDLSSCGARIHAVQASKGNSSGARSAAGQGPGQWALEREAPMGAVEVVVVRELDQDSTEVSLVDDDQVIKLSRRIERTSRLLSTGEFHGSPARRE